MLKKLATFHWEYETYQNALSHICTCIYVFLTLPLFCCYAYKVYAVCVACFALANDNSLAGVCTLTFPCDREPTDILPSCVPIQFLQSQHQLSTCKFNLV